MRLKNVFSIIAMLLVVFMFGCTKVDDKTSVTPTVTSTNPQNNVTGVPRNTAVEFTFSEEMDPLTINTSTFSLMQGVTTVPGVVSYSGTTATFTPSDPLAAVTTYTATMTTGAKSLTGNSLANNNVWSFTTGGTASGLSVVNLGTAGNFAILAKTEVSTTGTTHINGDIGISPAAATFITGFALILPAGGAFSTSALVTGNIYAPTYASPTPANMTTAISNMETAYTDAAGRTLPDFTELYAGNIGGKTLIPGLYKWSSTVLIPSSITISGSATDVWIFQISKDLTVSNAVNVTLSGAALAKNIFWQVAGITSMGTTSHFEGNILCKTGITFKTGASMNGRALAQTAVVLDANAITKPQ
ncbi:MAG: ice-binding family protein [Bacteroidales bacterium]